MDKEIFVVATTEDALVVRAQGEAFDAVLLVFRFHFLDFWSNPFPPVDDFICRPQ